MFVLPPWKLHGDKLPHSLDLFSFFDTILNLAEGSQCVSTTDIFGQTIQGPGQAAAPVNTRQYAHRVC